MRFDEDIYTQIILRVKILEELKLLIDRANDDLLVVLRIHLMCEHLLEAWICASIGRYDFFSNPKKLKLHFSSKLAIAVNLDLPKPAFDFFYEINGVRNSFSHRIDTKNITVGLAAQLEKTISKLVPHGSPKLKISEGEKDLYNIDDPNTPERIKLCMLFLLFQLNLTIARMPETESDESEDKKTATITFKI